MSKSQELESLQPAIGIIDLIVGTQLYTSNELSAVYGVDKIACTFTVQNDNTV